MLVATPYRDFDAPPRIISETRKNYADLLIPLRNFKPRLSGDLLVKCNTDTQWWPQRATIRNGQLYLDRPNEMKTALWRLPLRYLSLQAGNLPNSLSICRGRNILLTLQMPNQQQFDLWVKTIAVELIRQTPLDAVKYLDIFTLANCWPQKSRTNQPDNKDCNFNGFNHLNDCNTCQIQPTTTEFYHQDDEDAVHISTSASIEEKTVEKLLEKCQNVETYVPVKEKLILFESLCRLGRKVRSSEDVSCRTLTKITTKRARSMHDLTNLTQQSAVREICKYFEIKNSNSSNNSESLKEHSTVQRNYKKYQQNVR